MAFASVLLLLLAADAHGALLTTHAHGSFLVSPRAMRTPATMQMPMAATQLVTLIGRAPNEIQFQLVMDAIAELYDVREVPFRVGDVKSDPGKNMGSAKIFSFAQISKLDKEATLHLFGDYYRVDVLENPDGDDHANIRVRCVPHAVKAPVARIAQWHVSLTSRARTLAPWTGIHERWLGFCRISGGISPDSQVMDEAGTARLVMLLPSAPPKGSEIRRAVQTRWCSRWHVRLPRTLLPWMRVVWLRSGPRWDCPCLREKCVAACWLPSRAQRLGRLSNILYRGCI